MTRRTHLALLVGLVASPWGCARRTDTTPVPPIEAPTEPDPDRLFAEGRFEAAVAAYTDALATELDPSERTRLRLFRALALRARGDRHGNRLALEALREIEHQQERTIWGRIARLFVDEMAREEALRDTVLQAAARLRDVQAEVEALEAQLAERDELLEEQRSNLANLKEERSRLAGQLSEAEAQAEKQAARLQELERELAALKQIDMQRQP